jgi:aminoglycoside phosphotransferase (APT) family kinase protein
MSDKLDRQTAFSGVKEVSEKLAFDVKALELYLKSHMKGYAGDLSVKQFKGGQSNPTYFMESASGQYVLRRKPPGKLLPSAHAVDREFKIISGLHPQGFPVAKPHVLCEDEGVIGTSFYVMDFVSGRIIWDPALKQVSTDERQAIYRELPKRLAQLHSYTPSEIGLGDYGRGENYVSRQVDRWSKQYRMSETLAIPSMEELISWLPAHLPPAQTPTLVHGDFRLDNTILHPEKPEVLAVLDWELSTIGDPLADLTYYLLAWVLPRSQDGAGTGTLVGEDIAALGIPTMQEIAARYGEVTGLDALPHLNTYMAYNLFRLACILQGIVGRVRDGTASSADASRMASMVPLLANKARDFMMQA